MIRLVAAALPLALLALPAAAQMQGHSHEGMDMGGMEMAAPSTRPEAPSTRALQDADAAMMKGMDLPYTGDIDVDFRAHMIPHHQGAVDMAKVALQYSKDPDTRALAETIIRDQEKEIADMQRWLQARDKAAPAK